jgi:hypothetical protein
MKDSPEYAEHLQALTARRTTRRQRVARVRAELAAARAAGLRSRHAQKAARLGLAEYLDPGADKRYDIACDARADEAAERGQR